MWRAAAGDDRFDPASPERAAVLVVVLAAVGEQLVGALAGPADLAGDGADLLDQRQQLRDVVAVAARQRDGERNTVAVDNQVVL